MNEPFADISFDRGSGELKGRGAEIGLSARTIPIFADLWHARGDHVALIERYGLDKTLRGIRTLRLILPRFGLAVRAGGRGNARTHRLVDLNHQHERASS